jgi:hypothetical protein
MHSCIDVCYRQNNQEMMEKLKRKLQTEHRKIMDINLEILVYLPAKVSLCVGGLKLEDWG